MKRKKATLKRKIKKLPPWSYLMRLYQLPKEVIDELNKMDEK